MSLLCSFFSPWSMLSLDKINRETEAGESCVMTPGLEVHCLELRTDGDQEVAREFKSLPLLGSRIAPQWCPQPKAS